MNQHVNQGAACPDEATRLKHKDDYNNWMELLGRITINDHKAFGRLIADYATGRKAWPQTLEEFKREVEDTNIAKLPAHMKAIQVVQPSEDVFFLRLPPLKMISQSLERFGEADATGKMERYPAPPFYMDMVCGEERLTHTDFFLSRVADYTISVCT